MSVLKLSKEFYLKTAQVIDNVSINSNFAKGGIEIIEGKIHEYLKSAHKLNDDEFNIYVYINDINDVHGTELQPLVSEAEGYFHLVIEIEEYKYSKPLEQNVFNFIKNLTAPFSGKFGITSSMYKTNNYPVL